MLLTFLSLQEQSLSFYHAYPSSCCWQLQVFLHAPSYLPNLTHKHHHVKVTVMPFTRDNPALASKIAQLRLPLRPLVRVTTSEPHPLFPSTVLQFWLLTSEQLDDLASFYHQRTPCEWSTQYPCPVPWDTGAELETKRRRMGRFIGLNGCQSPVGQGDEGKMWEEELMKQAREQRWKEEEEDMWRRKLRWYS